MQNMELLWNMLLRPQFNNKNIMRQIERRYADVNEILVKNRRYKNIHSNQRCFILGNGPSLNDIRFELLKDEITFTVNRLNLHPDYEKLHSNYHFITDEEVFGLKNGRKLQNGFSEYAMEQIKSLRDKGRPTLFVPIEARSKMKKYKLDQMLCIRYFVNGRRFIDGYRNDDITKPVPCFGSVVAYPIVWALYMGIKEIYMLGCDQTILRDVIESMLGNRIVNDHAYKGEEKMHEDGYRQYVKERGFTMYLQAEIELQKMYRQLYAWCRSKGIKLYNLSSSTLIEGIPRKDFRDVI